MGCNQRAAIIGHKEQEQRHEDRHDNRQTGNLRKSKPRLVLRRLAAPRRPWTGRSLTVMAAVMTVPAMEIK